MVSESKSIEGLLSKLFVTQIESARPEGDLAWSLVRVRKLLRAGVVWFWSSPQ